MNESIIWLIQSISVYHLRGTLQNNVDVQCTIFQKMVLFSRKDLKVLQTFLEQTKFANIPSKGWSIFIERSYYFRVSWYVPQSIFLFSISINEFVIVSEGWLYLFLLFTPLFFVDYDQNASESLSIHYCHLKSCHTWNSSSHVLIPRKEGSKYGNVYAFASNCNLITWWSTDSLLPINISSLVNFLNIIYHFSI